MRRMVFASYGAGGAAIEYWQSGLRQFVARLKAAGYDTLDSPYNWSDVNAIVGEINRSASDSLIAVTGASLGANEAPDVADRTLRKIRYLGGFQTSGWGYRTGVSPNVDYADNFYNPGFLGWLRTLGMGSAMWYPDRGNVRTIIRNIPVYESHPGDWGIAQDLMYAQIRKLMP